MTEKLKITKTDGQVLVLHLEGDLDGQTENLLMTEAQAVLDAGKKSLVIDLTNVNMVTSAGLRAFHNIYKMFTSPAEIQTWQAEHADEVYKSPSFKMAQPSPQVHYVLSIAGFLQNIYIYPTLEEALKSFS